MNSYLSSFIQSTGISPSRKKIPKQTPAPSEYLPGIPKVAASALDSHVEGPAEALDWKQTQAPPQPDVVSTPASFVETPASHPPPPKPPDPGPPVSGTSPASRHESGVSFPGAESGAISTEKMPEYLHPKNIDEAPLAPSTSPKFPEEPKAARVMKAVPVSRPTSPHSSVPQDHEQEKVTLFTNAAARTREDESVGPITKPHHDMSPPEKTSEEIRKSPAGDAAATWGDVRNWVAKNPVRQMVFQTPHREMEAGDLEKNISDNPNGKKTIGISSTRAEAPDQEIRSDGDFQISIGSIDLIVEAPENKHSAPGSDFPQNTSSRGAEDFRSRLSRHYITMV